MPSWVPYFPGLEVRGCRIVPISGARHDPCGLVYHASSLSNEIGKCFVEFEEEDTVLKLKGVVVDVVVSSGDVAPNSISNEEGTPKSLAKTISIGILCPLSLKESIVSRESWNIKHSGELLSSTKR